MHNIEEMDQETAKQLLIEGAIFIFLGIPEGTEFGIDMKSWNTAENFKGVKMIPPGLHYIHYSAVNNIGDIAPRTGFFHNFKKCEILVKKWNNKAEDMSYESASEAEIKKIRENFLNLDRFLGPYPYDVYKKWLDLSNHLQNDLTIKLSPSSGRIHSALELVSCDDANRPRGKPDITESQPSCSENTISQHKRRRRRASDLPEDDILLPDLKPKEGTELRFTKFPDCNYPEDATPAQITMHSLDSSYVLERMLENHKNSLDFIGEIQFAFICFLIGHSLEAFEQWKELIGLLCSCENAIVKHRILYDYIVPILETHLTEIPEEFLADIVSNNNFIYCKLRTLFRAVQESNVDGRLKTKMERFKDSLTEKYLWDFSHLNEEDEDEAPVIVDV